MSKLHLPVDDALPEIVAQLGRHPAAIVVAPPGSGKTTRVAPALLDAEFLPKNRQIWLLQPRRVAARSTAYRIASERNQNVGQEIGYQVRFEKKTSSNTRIVVATDGVLLRRITTDPLLDGIGIVVLDEFHERSLNLDLLLAMLRRIQLAGRDDLKIVVMSATMEAGPIQQYLDNAPLVTAGGQSHELAIRYSPPRRTTEMTDHVVDTIASTVPKSEGDILVFLPGTGEIHSAKRKLESQTGLRDWQVLTLFGSMPLEQQSQVLQSSGRSRIILATNVAETSLTIEGIRTVIDSGLVRVLRFDPDVGLDRLELEPVCQASAAQRAGRAGRTASGVCIRLWDEAAQKSRPRFLDPEIRRVDLSGAVLNLLSWGESADDFPWFESPRTESIDAASHLLKRLGVTRDNKLTELGQIMSSLPIAPRLARMLVAGHQLGHPEPVALAAAMLSERDPFLRSRGNAVSSSHNRSGVTTATRWDCDVAQRVLSLHDYYSGGTPVSPFGEIHRGAAASILDVARQLVEQANEALGQPTATIENVETAIQKSLLAAMPDRLARRRDTNSSRGLMVGGRGVKLGPQSGVQLAELFLCVDVDSASSDALVRQASSIQQEWLDPTLIQTKNDLFFAPSSRSVQQRRRDYWDDLVLAETPVAIGDDDRCAEILFEAARPAIKEILPDGEAVGSLAARVDLLRRFAPELELPAIDDSFLQSVLRELCTGRKDFDQLRSAPWLDWIRGRFNSDQWSAIDRETPERIRVPSGSQIAVVYAESKPPVLAVRIQEIFSWTATPRIVFGRVPILLHLLAPNMRPQQVTDDLASFWQNGYNTVRGELRRRYPKHPWPEDPVTAEPVRKGQTKK